MIAGDTQALPKKRYFFISASEVAINVYYCMLHLTHRFIIHCHDAFSEKARFPLS